jgi:starch synthase
MACGLAVVATRAGGLPEAVADGETGLLVPPQDDDAMSEAILRLLRDPARRRALGAAGRERVEKEFGIERMITDTVRVYTDRAAPA